MTETADVLKEIKRLASPKEAPWEWKTCPTCREMFPDADPISWDWMNLRPCPFFLGIQKHFAEVCVNCAESVQVFPWLAEKYPIPMVHLDIDDRKTYLRGGSYLRPVAFVEAMEMKFMVTSASNYKIHVRRMGSSDPLKEYDNTFQAWLAIRANIEKGDDPKLTDDWGARPAVTHRRKKP
jgi:hypothetical protein